MRNYDMLANSIKKLIPQLAHSLLSTRTTEAKPAQSNTSEKAATSLVQTRTKPKVYDVKYLQKSGFFINPEDPDFS